jgi:hypothetical protein
VWSDEIRGALTEAHTVLVVIGPEWLSAGSSEWGTRRIDKEDDWVRQELAIALHERKRVIPVLIREARMPPADVLPEELRVLPTHQAISLRRDYWDHHIRLLLAQLPAGAKRTDHEKSDSSPSTRSSPKDTEPTLEQILRTASAAPALQWIVDTLIKKHAETTDDRRKRWDRVADFLETVAGVIQSAASDFKADKIPHGHYSQLVSIGNDLGDVIGQLYSDEDNATAKKRHTSSPANGRNRKSRSAPAIAPARSIGINIINPYRSKATNAFREAVHIIDEMDTTILEGSDSPHSPKGMKVLADLEAASGTFRALAMTIRARA